MKKWYMLLTGIFLLSASLWVAPLPAAAPMVLAPGETAIVRVYYPNPEMGNKTLISFEAQLLETNYGKGYHVMRVTREDVDRLTAAGLRVVPDDAWTASPPEATADDEEDDTVIPKYPCYRTVEATFDTAATLAEMYPILVEWIDVGDSWEKTDSPGVRGYDMLVLKLTNRDILDDNKPVLLITAAMHAREYATAELVTRFGEYLVSNYGLDPDVTWILDHHEIHLMLQTNPDGRKQAESGLSWRKNTNETYCLEDPDNRGADLNRNFSFAWNCCDGSSDDACNATYHGMFATSEPEIQAVEAYMEMIFPDQREDDRDSPAPAEATGIYIDVHSYGKLVLWPWGSTGDLPPNATQLQTLGRKFAYWNDYSPEQAIGLYPTDGTSDEHAYGHLGVASYCFEVGTSFFQPCNRFEKTIVPDNLPALLYAAKVVRTPYMTPAGPDAMNLSVGSDPVPAGTPAALTATIDDTRYRILRGNVENEPVQNIAAAEFYIDTPPWAGGVGLTMDPGDGAFNTTVETVTAEIDTAGLEAGRHLVFVRGQDENGNWGAFSAVFLTITE
ncbi:MAG: carboxypeptidase [Deltaproteobacteria bacterium]|nr:carboxypeptidase [Deltaproteobacteria bacterium]